MTVRSYSDLIAWQKAMTLVESIYKTTQQLPREERYGLVSQMRRAAVSIPSNIAEGEGRELETQTLIAQRLRLLKEADTKPLFDQCDEVGRVLDGLMKSVSSRIRAKQRRI